MVVIVFVVEWSYVHRYGYKIIQRILVLKSDIHLFYFSLIH